MLRMQELAFPCFKNILGEYTPRPPPFMRGMLATHAAFCHCYPPLIYYLTERSIFKKCTPLPTHGKILKIRKIPTHRKILRNWNDSRIFDNVAVSDIGRRSENISFTGVVFGTGITSASFHCLGSCACLIEVLNIIVTGSESSMENVLRIQFSMPSGPGALLHWIFFKWDSIVM